jgi:hypothetical protein
MPAVLTKLRTAVAVFSLVLACCAKRQAPARASYSSLAEVEAVYGPLVTAGNHPTPDQSGTGERVGLFKDSSGTLWGLPLIASGSGAIQVCAPPALREQKVTDTFPAGATVIGSTNEPTGWRGGTGNLELMLRDATGAVRWQAVRGAAMAGGPACWARELPGPVQQLHYYRLAPAPKTGTD